MGIYIWDNPYDWALFSFSQWAILLSVVLFISIVLNLILYYKFDLFQNKLKILNMPKPEFIDGKRVHTLTFPQGSEGGIFSKTYIPLDGHNIIRVRIQMIKPHELWDKKENIN